LKLVFLTNNFQLPPLTIAQLYKDRWQIELFFRWIKQHLRIQAFYGTSENAVKTQIWIAVTVYVLAAIVKKRLDLPVSLYSFLQVAGLRGLRKNAHFTAISASHFPFSLQPPILINSNYWTFSRTAVGLAVHSAPFAESEACPPIAT
jgi:hypothetical protein